MNTPGPGRWALALAFALAFAVQLATLAGCGDDDPTQPPVTPSRLVPLGLGNYWTYVDSLVTSTGTYVDIDTVLVVAMRAEGAHTWFELQSTFSPSIGASEFMTRSDSVFSLQPTEAPGGQVAKVVSLEYIRAQDTDTSTYNSVFGGDVLLVKSVTALNQTHTVPAGSFTDCAAYDYEIFPEHYREVLKPGVGILSWDVRADSSVYGPAWSRTRVLLGYDVSTP